MELVLLEMVGERERGDWVGWMAGSQAGRLTCLAGLHVSVALRYRTEQTGATPLAQPHPLPPGRFSLSPFALLPA